MICTVSQINSGDQIEKNEMLHVWGRGKVNASFWWGNLRERDHFQD